MTDAAQILDEVRRWARSGGARMLIDGELVGCDEAGRGGGRRTAPTGDPSTGEVAALVPVASATDVERAVEAGRRAYPGWFALGLSGRRRLLEQLGGRVAADVERLAMLDAWNSGNPYPGMIADISRGVHQFTSWPAIAAMHGGSTIPVDPRRLHFTERAPYGVVGRITAYNHPAYFAIKAIIPPLVMGNAVVLKASDQAPLSALRLGELAADLLPPGVLSVLSGDAATGAALVAHRSVKRIGFTGSTAVGRTIQAGAAAAGLKHVSLELGGKNTLIAFPDAPLGLVADAAVRGMSLDTCQGQSCGSTSRLFAHRDIAAELVEAVAARLEAIRPGPAYAEGTGIGPLVSAAQRRRVAGYVRSGAEEGARLVAGGAPGEDPRPEDHELPPGGHYFAPTLFDRVTQEMTIAHEEIFGPVISVLEWSDRQAMLEQVNSVSYGLTGSVWTNDLRLALETARAVEAGFVWVNDVASHYFGVPFGGVKESGVGREECLEELESYAELRAINLATPYGGEIR